MKTEMPCNCDLLVVGGGYAGICAAIAGARKGMRTILLEKEMQLGGNGGPNLGVGSTGLMGCNPYYNEGGIQEELEEEISWHNARTSPTNFGYNVNPVWDDVVTGMLQKAGVQVLRKHCLVSCATENQKITAVRVLNLENLQWVNIQVTGFCVDATGDAQLASFSGADTIMGREGKGETGERCAPEVPDQIVSTASLTALVLNTGVESTFVPPEGTPPWNPEKPDNHFNPAQKLHFLWQVDEGGENDENHPLYTPQALYQKLRLRIYSVWNYLKNIKFKEECRNHQLIWISPILGRRESRRILGDYLLTQTDIEEGREFADKVAFAGAYLDEHMPSYDGGYEVRFYTKPLPYDIPFRCLYSRNVENLFSAGRNIGVSHLAFTSTRLMRTCGVLGQVVGLAASYCKQHACTPRELYQSHMNAFQQLLCREDVGILGAVQPLPPIAMKVSQEMGISRTVPAGEFVKNSSSRVLLYHYPEKLETVSFYLRNKGAQTSMTVTLGYGETAPIKTFPVPNFILDPMTHVYRKEIPDAKGVRAAAAEGVINPTGTAGWDEFYLRDDRITEIHPYIQQTKTIPADFEGFVEFTFAQEEPFPPMNRHVIGQAAVLDIEGEVELLASPHPLDVLDWISGNRPVSGNSTPIMKISPEIYPGEADNLRNGKICRMGRGQLNSWTALAGDWVELACNQEISRCVITFDKLEKLWGDMYLMKQDRTARRLVREYRLEGKREGDWILLAHITDNYHQHNDLSVEPAFYESIRLTILSVWDESQPGKVLEVYFE